MAKCDYCNKDMARANGCTLTVFDDLPGGIPTLRIRYGSEPKDWGAKSGRRCGDCGVKPGFFHHPGCDVEHCPVCYGQAMCCECMADEDDEEEVDEVELAENYDHNDWVPIEKFFGGCGVPEVEAFMYMGRSRTQDGRTVWMYKHCDTRKYIWLDEDAEPYRPCDWDPALVQTSRNVAMAMVYDGIDEGLYLSRPGSMPRFEIFPMERNRSEAS